MFLSFDLLAFLFWLFVSTFLPGAILSISLFKKDDFSLIEKLFIGFALGFILLPLIPFILYVVAGVKFSFDIVLLSVAVLYIAAIAMFVKNKAYKNISLPAFGPPQYRGIMMVAALLAILIVSYMIRLSSYGPIFQELDPYYYTYPAQQLLVLGENIPDDQTAWYPEIVVNHRIIPAISYLEATWYSLYTGGGEYSNMLLSVIAGMYPPLAAVLSLFFIYLLVSTASKREWGLVAAGIAAFVPVFVFKLAAGEMEVQAYAFFSLMFLYAMYAISLKKKDLRFSVLAGLGFAAVSLGSSSQLLALASLMLFMVMQGLAYFLRDKDEEELEFLLKSSTIVFVLGPLLGSSLLKDIFSFGAPQLTIVLPFFIAVASVGFLYLIKKKVPDRGRALAALGLVAVAGLLVFAFSPLGGYVKGIGESGFGLSEFNRPLDRTIAEQGVAPTAFGGNIGFVADTYIEESRPAVVGTILWPLVLVFNLLSKGLGEALALVIGTLISFILLPISILVNVIFYIGVNILNAFLGTTVEYSDKANSFMLFWTFAFWVALSYSLYLFMKKDEDNLFILLFAIIMPPFLVGIIKAKYTIYSGVLLAVAIGFTFGVSASAITAYLKDEEKRKSVLYGLLLTGAALVFLQFVSNSMALPLLWGSVQPLYQNDPMALQAKFQSFCIQSQDPTVCAAAADPMGFADLGTNSQYDQRLCLLSLYSDYNYISTGAPAHEAQSAYFRCQKIAPYWIDSMEWLKENTEEGSRIISWWDYGHWINFFGDRNAVLRNEHLSHEMIGAVAHGYLDATPEELKAYMQAHDSEYALFDVELIGGSGSLGGKYGALNYLSCAWSNETDVSNPPGLSECEAEHLWEVVYVSQKLCTISTLTERQGVIAYKIYEGGGYKPYYRSECTNPTDPNIVAYCQQMVRAEPVYCVAETTLATGQQTIATYYMNETYPNGDLKLNKAEAYFPYTIPTTYHMGPVTSITLIYTNNPIWLENGEMKSGYEDRKGKFYDSNLYRAIFLNSIPGFEQVYSTSGGAVKIYKIAE